MRRTHPLAILIHFCLCPDLLCSFHITEGVKAGEEVGKWPIPGLSIDFPGIASAGVVAGLEFDGNADELKIDGTLDVCGQIPIVGGSLCGSDIPDSGLPIDVIEMTEDFGDICKNYNATQIKQIQCKSATGGPGGFCPDTNKCCDGPSGTGQSCYNPDIQDCCTTGPGAGHVCPKNKCSTRTGFICD